jgi:oligo-1,6-glucosidase
MSRRKKLTLDSKLKDIYENPIGRDVIGKILLQMGKTEDALKNPVIMNLKLKSLAKLSNRSLGSDFFDTLLHLLNTEREGPREDSGKITKQWWKEAVFYQIYPRSFKDSNGDGVGDLEGIIEKLDYLKDLGIDAIWLSPIYDSPNDDNGYDIRDYSSILREYGTMATFDRLLEEVHKRDMRLIMDLVVNHTSDEHPWFQLALGDKGSKYRDYYIFRESKDGPPNNWISFFSGPAWNYYKEEDIWALHLFSKKQMDLNWENENLRKDISSMIRWWLEKGVDGFRLDVINYISKEPGLPDGNKTISELIGYCGVEHYFYGPKLHQYLRELKEEAFAPYNAFSVGETPGIGMEMSKLLTGDYRGEMDMIFSFDHLETPGYGKFDDYQYDLNYLKKYMIKWQEEYPNYCWQSLFYENHDNPRMVSKVNPSPKHRKKLAKLLAGIQLTLKGTPFIYQGQEIGMKNQDFKSMSQLRDVESINLYKELIKNETKEKSFATIMAGARDHARTPVQWSDDRYGGFSTSKPWIEGDDDYLKWNVGAQLEDKYSVLNFYKGLIQLRKKNLGLVYGRTKFVEKNTKDYMAYYRVLGKDRFLVECNLSDKILKERLKPEGYGKIMSNYVDDSKELRPYEFNIFYLSSK